MKAFARAIILLIVTIIFFASCARQKKERNNQFTHIGSVYYKVEAAPQWNNLFKKNLGWFGGDGIFAIPLDGVDRGSDGNFRTMLLFSDTMIGKIISGELQPGFSMVHNSIAYFSGTKPDSENIDFIWKKKKDGSPVTMFVPKTTIAEKEDYYWLGDGFVNKALHNIYIFAYRIRNTGKGAFPFKVVGNPLIVIPKGSKPPFNNQRQIKTPFTTFFKSDSGFSLRGTFGAGIFVNTKAADAPNPDGYIYVYGVEGPGKQLIAARVKPKNFENFNKWHYWDGNGWRANINSLQSITNQVSNELSVSAIGNGKYALIFTVNGVGAKIGMRIGESPAGPFGPPQIIWQSHVDSVDSTFFAYNAKGHPALSAPNELLVSYNVNSFKFFRKIKEFPHLYRPRFIRIIFKQK